jgi:transposase-like protein
MITLYRKGITTRKISDLIEKLYGHHYSPSTMSNISKAVAEQVKKFHSRPLSDKYVVIFLDATYLSIRCDTVARYIRNKDRKTVMGDLKKVYPSGSAGEAERVQRGFMKVSAEILEMFEQQAQESAA